MLHAILLVGGRLFLNDTIPVADVQHWLLRYEQFFALRQIQERSFHIGLLTAVGKIWETALPTVGQIGMLLFIIRLISKSIIITGDREFDEAFDVFAENIGLLVPKILVAPPPFNEIEATAVSVCYGNFLTTLGDLGFYSLVSKAIITYCDGLGEWPPAALAQVGKFLEIVLNPKLFVALSLTLDSFVEFWTSIITRGYDLTDIEPVQDVFKLFCRVITFFTPKMSVAIASRYIHLINVKRPGESWLDIQYPLAVMAFLLRNVTQEAFSDFYKTMTPEILQGLLHYILDKCKLPTGRPPPVRSSSPATPRPGSPRPPRTPN
jgi:hypothetical protein